jgi:hypothetical protein
MNKDKAQALMEVHMDLSCILAASNLISIAEYPMLQKKND